MLLMATGGGVAPRLLALLYETFRQPREQEIEHAVGVLLGRVQIFFYRCIDLARALGFQRFFALLVPVPGLGEICTHAQERLYAPRVLHFFLAAIAARIV